MVTQFLKKQVTHCHYELSFSNIITYIQKKKKKKKKDFLII